MEHFFKRILLTALVAVGAFSGEADALCAGTVRFKPPVDWTEAYFGTRNCSAVLAGHATTLDADGYFTFDLSNIGYQEMGATNFSILSSVTQGNIFAISRTGWVTAVGAGEAPQNALTNNANFPCPGAGNTVYIQDDPLSPGTTYIGENPPLAKYLYVLVPDDKDWQSDNMMVSTDGGVTGTKMENAFGADLSAVKLYESEAYRVLSYRANVIAWLKGMVLYVAHGYKWSKEIADFVRWTEQYNLWCKMLYFGKQLEKELREELDIQRQSGPQNLLELLPDEFNREQYRLMRQQQGKGGDGESTLRSWQTRGHIIFDEVSCRFCKTEEYKRKFSASA